MEKRNTLLLTVIAVATLLVAVVGATFAYFAGTVDTVNGNINVNANTAGAASSFIASAGNSLDLDVTAAMVQRSAINLTAKTTATGGLTVTFETGTNGQNASCTYDIVYVWDSVNVAEEGENPAIVNQYQNTGTLPLEILDSDPNFAEFAGTYNYEYSIQGNVIKTVDGGAPGESTSVLSETDFSSFTWSTDPAYGAAGHKATIVANQTISNSNTASASTDVYTFTTSFYNIPRNQNAISGKAYRGHLSVANVVC